MSQTKSTASSEKHGFRWTTLSDKWRVCSRCDAVEHADGKNNPCKGVKPKMRELQTARPSQPVSNEELKTAIESWRERHAGTPYFYKEAWDDLEATIQALLEAREKAAYERGLLEAPAAKMRARTKQAKLLRAQGMTIRDIVKIMGFNSPGSVSWLLKQPDEATLDQRRSG